MFYKPFTNCVGYSFNLTQASVICEEEATTKVMPPEDCLANKSMGPFFPKLILVMVII